MKRHYDQRDVIRKTYEDAVAAGDKNVYFWDGTENFAPYANYGTVEGDHPNDCGFYVIAVHHNCVNCRRFFRIN